nr:MAG TPA: hypothetical protein [Caudoviricetes sp.]
MHSAKYGLNHEKHLQYGLNHVIVIPSTEGQR